MFSSTDITNISKEAETKFQRAKGSSIEKDLLWVLELTQTLVQ